MQLVLKWVEAFACWDLETIYSLTTTRDDFAYAHLPASMGIAQKTLEEWHLHNSQMKTILPDFSVRRRASVVQQCSGDTNNYISQVEVLNVYECKSPSDTVTVHVRL